MGPAQRKAGSARTGSNLKQEEIVLKLERLGEAIADLRVNVVEGLGEMRGSIDVLNARMDTHLSYINQTLECQSEGLSKCQEELFGADGHTGIRSKLARLDANLRHSWWLWSSLLALIGGPLIYLLATRS